MAPNLYSVYKRLEPLPLGKRAASAALQVAAPYFMTIPAKFESLEPGRATTRMRAVPWTRNHLGTVHAISLCNLAEYTMGAVAEATVPTTHRWVPKGMNVSYTAMARGTMHATATLDIPANLGPKQELGVEVEIADDSGTVVCEATIEIHVTERA